MPSRDYTFWAKSPRGQKCLQTFYLSARIVSRRLRGGRGGKKEKKEVGKKREGIEERGKGTPAIITPSCSPSRTLASANSDWIIRQKNKLVQQTQLPISVSLRRVVIRRTGTSFDDGKTPGKD